MIDFDRAGKGSLRIDRYWEPKRLEEVQSLDTRQAAESVRDLMIDSVRLRMRSDVPLATCLSGGIDSSAIYATINRIGGSGERPERQAEDWQMAFVALYPGRDNSEQTLALDYIESLGATAKVTEVVPQRLIPDLARIIYDTEDIGTLFPAQWQLYRDLRRAGRVVSLDGHGADECLSGYPYNVHVAALQGINNLIMTADAFNGVTADPDAWTKMANQGGFPDIRGYRPTPNFSPGWYAKEPQHRLVQADPYPLRSVAWEADAADVAEQDLPFQLLYFQANCGWLQNILRTYDIAAMAHGVEVRTPFLDWRLFCYCLALPSAAKLADGLTKAVLRQAMAGTLPDPILSNARKTGFPSPVKDWLKGPLRPLVEDTVRSASFVDSPLWNGAAAKRMLADGRSRSGVEAYAMVWPSVQAQLLLDAFKEHRSG